MKVSREQMAENRTLLLNAASQLFRERGFDSVTVAEVMKSAGLTHGAFYGHFSSKDDLIAQTLEHALTAYSAGDLDLGTYLPTYLSARHRDNPGKGCPTAGLAADTRHQGPAARAAVADGLRTQISRLTKALPDGEEEDVRRAAIGTWAALVGAVVLSRSVDDVELSNEVLEQTRQWISSQIGVQPAS